MPSLSKGGRGKNDNKASGGRVMSNKRAWSEEFNSLKDFIELLNIPSNASGMFGRTAATTIIELEAERDALQARIKQLEAELEEERQENASLRSGDDYERGAE